MAPPGFSMSSPRIKSESRNENGNRYLRWLVLDRAPTNARNFQAADFWLCRCDCGVERVVRGAALRCGQSRSCGCYRDEKTSGRRALPHGEGSFRKTLGSMKRAARVRSLAWELEDDDVRRLTKEDCHYCGVPPSNTAYANRSTGEYVYNGLDRVDNNRGYLIDNVVPCCYVCNNAKRSLSLDDFRAWAGRLCDVFLTREDH